MRAHLGRLHGLLRGALTWWLGELRGLAQWLGVWRTRTSSLRIEFQNDRVRVHRRDGERWLTVAEELFEGTQFPAHMPALAEDSGQRCEVLIDRARILVRHLELPAAMEADLRSALALQIDRLMPYEPDWIYFDYEVLDRHRPRNRMALDLAIVERRVADAVDEAVRGWGLRPLQLSVHDGGRLRFDFRPPRQAAHVPAHLGRWMPAAIAAALVVAVSSLFAWTSREQRQLNDALAQVRAETRGARELQGRLQAQLARATYLDERMRRPSAVAVLADLTRALPDAAWVYELQLADGHLRIAGYAANASQLSPPLEATRLLAEVKLIQATRPDATDAAEQFQIEATVAEGSK